MRHLGPTGTVPDLPECPRALSFREPRLETGVEMKKPQGQQAAAVLDMAEELAATPELDAGLDDIAFDQDRLPHRGFTDSVEPRLVVVAQRQVQHQVEPVLDAEL